MSQAPLASAESSEWNGKSLLHYHSPNLPTHSVRALCSAHLVSQGSPTPMTQSAQMSYPDSVGSPHEAPATYQMTSLSTFPPPAPDDWLDELIDEFLDGGEGGGSFPPPPSPPPRKPEESDSLELAIDGALLFGLGGPRLGGTVCTISISSELNGIIFFKLQNMHTRNELVVARSLQLKGHIAVTFLTIL